MNPNMLMGLVAVLAVANLGLVATNTMVVNDAQDDDSRYLPDGAVQPAPIGNAAAIFVKFEGIDGESKDADHEKWIDVLSWSHDRSVPTDAATGEPAGIAGSSSVVLVKELDKASPKLAESLSTGETMDVEFDIMVSTNPPEMVRLKGVLRNSSIAAVHTTDFLYHTGDEMKGSTVLIAEQITLNYEKITWTYDEGGVKHTDSWTLGSSSAFTNPVTTGDFNGYIRLTGIDGESTASGHEDEIDVLSWSWGMSQSGLAGGGGAGGTVRIQDFSFVKEIDKASPKLAEALASGEHIDSAELVLRRTDSEGSSSNYLTINMLTIQVTSIDPVNEYPNPWSAPIAIESRDILKTYYESAERVSISFEIGTITYPEAGVNGTDLVLNATPWMALESLSTRYYMEIEGIDGDVTDEGREGTVLLYDFDHRIFGDPDFEPLKKGTKPVTISKPIDKASPLLMGFLNDGETFNATIFVDEVRVMSNGSTERVEYFKYELKNVMVTSVSTGGGGGEDRLTESISLNFVEVKTTYVQQKRTFVETWTDSEEDQYHMDMFLDIEGEGFAGESTADGHEDEIDVLSWSWDVSQSGSAGGVVVEDITFTKYVDKATPMLMQAMANGEDLGNATFFMRRAGESEPFMTTEMISMSIVSIEPVSVSSRVEVRGWDPTRAYEEVTIRVNRIDMAYRDPGGGEDITVVVKAEKITPPPDLTELTMEIDGLEGDDTYYSVVIDSFAHQISDSIGTDGLPTGKRIHSPFQVVKTFDAASPYLHKAMTDGTGMNVTVSLDHVSPDGSRVTYYAYELKNVLVTSYSTGGAGGDDGPIELVSLNYGKITWNYVELGIEEEDIGVFEEPAAANVYMHIEGIEGESTDADHEGWIELLSLDWGLSSDTRDASSGLPTGKRQHKAVAITKLMDKASPKLYQALSEGNPLDISIEVYKEDANGTMVHFLTLNMTEAEMLSMDVDYGHVTVLKAQEGGGHVTVLKAGEDTDGILGDVTAVKSMDTSTVSLEQSRFKYAELSVTYEQTGDSFFDVWVDPKAIAGYVKIGDIKGESTDADHRDWVEVLSYSHSLTYDLAGLELTDGQPTGRRIHTPLVLTKYFDSSSPSLARVRPIDEKLEVSFELYRPGTGTTLEHYMTIDLVNASVTSYDIDYRDDDSEGDGVPIETFSLIYEEIQWTYVGSGEMVNDTWYDPSMAPNAAASYVKFDGIDGGSKDTGHDGWSDLVVVSYGIREEIESATGLPTGKTEVSDVVVVKEVDKSTPLLMMAVASRNTYNVTIERYQANASVADGREIYLTIELTNASIKSVMSHDDDCNDRVGTDADLEKIVISFESIKWTWELLGIEHEDIG